MMYVQEHIVAALDVLPASFLCSCSKIHQRNQQPRMTMTQWSILFLSLDNWIAERQDVEKEENSPIECNSRLRSQCPQRCKSLEQLFECLVVISSISEAIDVRLSKNNLSPFVLSDAHTSMITSLAFSPSLSLIFIQSPVQIHICARIHTMK